jgi:hypothetical protein
MIRVFNSLPLRRARRTHSLHGGGWAAWCLRQLGYLLGGIAIAAVGWLFFILAFSL